jgi:hypothetical protein
VQTVIQQNDLSAEEAFAPIFSRNDLFGQRNTQRYQVLNVAWSFIVLCALIEL